MEGVDVPPPPITSSSSHHPPPPRFEIYVSRDTFKFNASHFVAYRGFRERLHGHNYRASVRLVGSGNVGGDGYVLDFGCVKEAVKDVCGDMNEHFIVPMLSDVLGIDVVEEGEAEEVEEEVEEVDEEDDDGTEAGNITTQTKTTTITTTTTTTATTATTTTTTGRGKKRRALCHRQSPTSMKGGTVTIICEDGSRFVFPRQDCLLLPIMHSTAEELAIYLYGKILSRLNANYLIERGVTSMEVTISEAVGQEAVFRRAIPNARNSVGGGNEAGGEGEEDPFDVASYVSRGRIPVMPCKTDTEGARRLRTDPS
ncbi:hypothetical protein ACHAXA_000865 [Cyclostephanos tholiformis]|uniref:6-pyruvoyltetrahydropterin synthase n=1 Tax=Cyclostephanos tholiformis TaxID=382380 RepID=A0ABD3SRN4_9STRA